jgi:hypothetical protein
MTQIPPFEKAQWEVSKFLVSQGYPPVLVWVFRDDMYLLGPSRLAVRWPVPDSTQSLVEKVYREGRSRGMIGVRIVGRAAQSVASTVWYPKTSDENSEGWSDRLKLTINTPLPQITRIPSVFWPVARWTSAYRRYQGAQNTIGSREWAAA